MNADAPVLPQFDDAGQQCRAATLGMWLFLSTEVLFFGALFLCYTAYRINHPQALRETARHTLVLVGSINTAVLIANSFTMALAVRAAQLRQRSALMWLMSATAALGLIFLTIKGFEYHHEIGEGLWPGADSIWLAQIMAPHGCSFLSTFL